VRRSTPPCGSSRPTTPSCATCCPKGYQRLEKSTLTELLRLFAPLPRKLSGDAFGLIYEDFLSNFAMAEGRLGGEFFTPYSIVRLIVEIIEPFHGKVFDPACGSGGMFVQCAKFVERHARLGDPGAVDLRPGAEGGHRPLAKMNLALHGLSGDIRLGNSYYDDLHNSVGAFDFVMANPPFNVNGVDKDKLAGDPRFPFGLPRPTTATTCGSSSSTPRSTTAAAPGSSWPTPPATPGTPSARSAASSSSPAPST
jgi:type I restriction enzyme M protein